MSLSSGTTLGPYNVTARIGEGGMGQVYQATDTTLNRQVALRVLSCALGFSWTLDCERVLAGGVSR